MTLLVETTADGGVFRARVVRVEDAFSSDVALDEKENGKTDADALADAAVEAALSCFFAREGDGSVSDRPAEDAFEFV